MDAENILILAKRSKRVHFASHGAGLYNSNYSGDYINLSLFVFLGETSLIIDGNSEM